jgi:membrane protein
LRSAWSEYERDYARYFAKSIVYHALLSMIPLLLLLLATLGLLLRYSETAAQFEQRVLHAIEGGFGMPLRAVIEQMLQRMQEGSLIATAVSLIGLLVTAAALFRHLRMTFRAIWKQPPPLASGSLWDIVRVSLREHVIAFTMVLAGGALLLAALILLSAIHWLRAGWVLTLPGPLLGVLLIFALLFRFLPPVRLTWGDVWLSAALCTAVWLIGAEIFALYGTAFGGGFGAYGALGGVLLLMVWLNVVTQVLFYGAELCKVVASERRPA